MNSEMQMRINRKDAKTPRLEKTLRKQIRVGKMTKTNSLNSWRIFLTWRLGVLAVHPHFGRRGIGEP
jgi:hypothetical protein